MFISRGVAETGARPRLLKHESTARDPSQVRRRLSVSAAKRQRLCEEPLPLNTLNRLGRLVDDVIPSQSR